MYRYEKEPEDTMMLQADNQPYAEDEDNGFVHDPRHAALEPVVRRIYAAGVNGGWGSHLYAQDLADLLTEITDALDGEAEE